MKREWLIQLRGAESQKSLSARTGISQNHYSSIENGTRTPRVNTAKRIAQALGFDWTRFYGEKDILMPTMREHTVMSDIVARIRPVIGDRNADSLSNDIGLVPFECWMADAKMLLNAAIEH